MRKKREKPVKIKYKTIYTRKEKFPFKELICIILISMCMLCLVYSNVVLNEKSMEINRLRELIQIEKEKAKILNSKIEQFIPEEVIPVYKSPENILTYITEKIFYISK